MRLSKKYLRNIRWNKLNKPNLVMLCGLPGSGKSVYAEMLHDKYGYVVHSSDSIRKELFGDEQSQEDNTMVFNLLHKRVKDDLVDGKCVVYDATNLSRRRRKYLLTNYLKGVECTKYCYFIPTPYKKCLKNNKKRDRRVPENVIKHMYMTFQVPAKTDGFDDVFIDRNAIRHKSLSWLLFKLSFIKQHNPYHDFTIGKHCRKTSKICSSYSAGILTELAAKMHDIGKKFCRIKTYKDGKLVCKFFRHENVSAYESFHYMPKWMFNNVQDRWILYTALLINEHDRLMHSDSVRAREKIIDEFGTVFYRDLDTLHDADISSQKKRRK